MKDDNLPEVNLTDYVNPSIRVTQGIFECADGRTLESIFDLLDVHVRFNERSKLYEIKGLNRWETLTDLKENYIRNEISERFRLTSNSGVRQMYYSGERWTISLGSILSKNTCDPFRVWLGSLPEWDGVERIGNVLNEAFGCEDTRLNRWASEFLFKGVVQRTYEPGSKLDEMPVLVGKQGIGKSSLLSNILPPEEPDWFNNDLHLAADSKTRAEALQGRVIVEACEMSGSSNAELESLKAFLTRQDDGGVRLAYRRNPERMLRRCIIVGTADKHGILPNDPSGNRRFVVVECPRGSNVEILCDDNRSQWWAEAVNWHFNRQPNFGANLPRDLMTERDQINEQYRSSDVIIEDKILEHDWKDGLYSLQKIMGILGVSSDKISDQRRVANALRLTGFETVRVSINGKRARRWKHIKV